MIKKALLTLVVTIALMGLAAIVWSYIPVTIDREAPDPAVVHLNKQTASGPQYQENYFSHQGHQLHYVGAGEGETILFVHGFPSTWLSFAHQLEAFKSDYHVVAIDGLGAGKSDAPSNVDAYGLEAMTAHVAALLEQKGINKLHLVGHDWGSAFVTGFAQRYPDKVISVTGISAPPQNVIADLLAENPDGSKFSYIETFKKANAVILLALGVEGRIYDGAYGPLVEAGHLTQVEGDLFRAATSNPKRVNAHINWYRANIPAPEDITNADYWPSKDTRVTVPALYIWGLDDQIYDEAALEKTKALSDNAAMLLLPDVGHWPHVERAELVTAAIRRHIGAVAGEAVKPQLK